MKIKDIGEFGLIDRISRKIHNKNIHVGIGDDAAVVEFNDLLVLTTDCLVEGDHFNCDWFKPNQIGKKAIEINVSDVAAMGGIPDYALISLCLPKNLEVSFVDDLYEGFLDSSRKYDIDIIGGNMAHSKQIMISIVLLGSVDNENLTLRSGAKPGDLLFLSDSIGWGRAGLRLFQENISSYEKLRRRYLEPNARLDFSRRISPYVNSMIDISDGLAPEVKHICEESNCGAIIYKDKIPIDKDVISFANHLSEDAYDYALFGGEDFELLYSVSKENKDNSNGILIGEITKNGIFLCSDDKKIKMKSNGFDHFTG
jgi:thiamine-monophosphate kinase